MAARPSLLPRGMQEGAAAAYIGVSPSKLRSLAIPRRIMGGNRVYDRLDLDAWFGALPYENEAAEEANPWDAAS